MKWTKIIVVMIMGLLMLGTLYNVVIAVDYSYYGGQDYRKELKKNDKESFILPYANMKEEYKNIYCIEKGQDFMTEELNPVLKIVIDGKTADFYEPGSSEPKNKTPIICEENNILAGILTDGSIDGKTSYVYEKEKKTGTYVLRSSFIR